MMSTQNRMIKPRIFENIMRVVFLPLILMVALGVKASPSHISDKPLFLSASVEPNIMFILDDSGSMQWEIMPDGITYTSYLFPRPASLYGSGVYDGRIMRFLDTDIVNVHVRSSHNNAVFYDPTISYLPWVHHDGALYPDSDPTDALHNPSLPAVGSVNLTTEQTFNRWQGWTGSAWVYPNTDENFWPITYYVYKGSGSVWSPANYKKYQIRGANGYSQDLNGGTETLLAGFDWPGGITRTVLEERQNFANWYTYYRSRVLASRAGIGRAFSEQGEGMRVGFGAINVGTENIDGQDSNRAIVRGVRRFSGSDREQFFTDMYTHPIPTAGTPLRRALEATGEYYSRNDNPGPWGAVPGHNDSTAHLQCRQSYSILMTDGYWNGGNPAVGNSDNTSGSEHTNHDPNPNPASYQYSPSDPFRDNWTNTLADVAMHYWKNDLRTDLDNLVPSSPENPAFWQHMVTFGVGLGVSGTIGPQTAFDAIDNNDAIAWPDPAATNPAKLDDLLHAGVNSRGGYFTASDPITFAQELTETLDAIVARVESSATSAAASSAVLTSDTMVYTAGFRSTDWSGSLTARVFDSNGQVVSIDHIDDATLCPGCWDAEALLRSRVPADRQIFTRSASGSGAGGGVYLDGTLHVDQQTALNTNMSNATDGLGDERIEWLYGVEHDSLRGRAGPQGLRLLGDIIHSDPQYRHDVLYLGANDGMLHAFDANSGDELFAYVPSSLLRAEPGQNYAMINHLMDPNYDHRYFMDGLAAVQDVKDGSNTRTILVGTMGAGGRTVFALDVTDPHNFEAGDVLWEFEHAKLGYNTGKPVIVRLSNDTLAAVFANGYGSDEHTAALFVVNLLTGALIRVIDTGIGTAAIPNSLSEPFVTDWPELDLQAQRVIAGDVRGNLWVFDVSNSNAASWSFAKLFEAKDSGGISQPITARPSAAYDTSSGRLVVVFGTGSYFRHDDKLDMNTQSLYGVFYPSDGGTTVERSELLEQEVIHQVELSGFGEIRVLSNYLPGVADKGWVLDLPDNGERLLSTPQTLGHYEKRVRFSTMIPDDDPCGSGRRGFLMDFDVLTGGRTNFSVFDVSGDGLFDTSDMIEIEVDGELVWVAVSGTEQGMGEEKLVIRDEENDVERVCDGQGNCELSRPDDAQAAGRQHWKQMR